MGRKGGKAILLFLPRELRMKMINPFTTSSQLHKITHLGEIIPQVKVRDFVNRKYLWKKESARSKAKRPLTNPYTLALRSIKSHFPVATCPSLRGQLWSLIGELCRILMGSPLQTSLLGHKFNFRFLSLLPRVSSSRPCARGAGGAPCITSGEKHNF